MNINPGDLVTPTAQSYADKVVGIVRGYQHNEPRIYIEWLDVPDEFLYMVAHPESWRLETSWSLASVRVVA